MSYLEIKMEFRGIDLSNEGVIELFSRSEAQQHVNLQKIDSLDETINTPMFLGEEECYF